VTAIKKRRRAALAALAGMAALGGAAIAMAQSSGGIYDLSFSGISGGGGNSTGGSYALLGSIGQPLAGNASQGTYTLNGGFLGGGSSKVVRFMPSLSRDGLQ
jgi:hypothetical protein